MNWLEWLFAPAPKPVSDMKCFKCKTKHYIMDLGDGCFICENCWRNWIPNYSEIDP